MAPFTINLSTNAPTFSLYQTRRSKNDTLYHVKRIKDHNLVDFTKDYVKILGPNIVIAPNSMKLDEVLKEFFSNALAAWNPESKKLLGLLAIECDGFRKQILHDEYYMRQHFMVAINARLTPQSEQKAREFMAGATLVLFLGLTIHSPIIRAEQARKAREAKEQSDENERKKRAKRLLKKSTEHRSSSPNQVTRIVEKVGLKKST